MAQIDITQTQTVQYKDISLSFAKNPITNDILAITGADAVKRSIKHLLLTNAGEVPFFSDFGSKLRTLLFEPVDPITTALIRSEILSTINGYEPRAQVTSLVVTANEDEHSYQIDMVLRLVNQIQPVTLTLFLSRLR